MKKIAVGFGLSVLLLTTARAQSPDSLTVGQFQLDFITPDLPAFKALGTDPSDILRPSDVKQFALALNPFYNNPTLAVPKAFALEVSPGKIASGRWYFSEYRQDNLKAFFYRTSFSLGTLRRDEAGNASRLSVGLRTSWIPRKYDISRNDELADKVYDRAEALLEDRTNALIEWRQKNKVRPGQFERPGTVGDSLRAAFETYYRNLPRRGNLAFSEAAIARLFDEFQQKNWNAPRFDLAVAWLGASGDTLVRNVGFSSLQVWATQSLRAGSNGQWLIGLNARFNRTAPEAPQDNNSLSVNLRYYYGGTDFRGFVEGQFRQEAAQPNSTLLNVGGEFRVQKGFWILFSTGIRGYDSRNTPSRLLTALELRYSINRRP